MRRMLRLFGHVLAIGLLTLLTQVGGLAWIIAAFCKRRVWAFLSAYLILSTTAVFIAPFTGRVPLPCAGDGALQMRTVAYCALNRHYVTPELKTVLHDLANAVEESHPDTVTQVLDAGFPFLTGMPLLPHLSHDDGEKVDIAFYYEDETGYLTGRTPSPIGYFAFEGGPTACPKAWLTLRWNMGWIQPLWPEWKLEPHRTRKALQWLKQDGRVGKVFVEPHLSTRLRVQGGKIRFQGCRAARHDDHIHIQL